MTLSELLFELESAGIKNDAAVADRHLKQLNITKATGEFLSVLVKASGSKNILEVGTSNGYSTLWLADAIPNTGTVVTLELQQHKIHQAKANFERAGLANKIEIINADAIGFFSQSVGQFDFIFLDAERTEYMKYSDKLVKSLEPGGLLVCDNAISHAEEMAEFIEFIKSCREFSCSLVPVGKGEFLAYKNA